TARRAFIVQGRLDLMNTNRILLVLSVSFLFMHVCVHAETLQDLQQQLLKNNPEIAAAKNRYLAASKLSTQEATLPDPTISFTDLGAGHPFSRLNDSEFAYRGFGFSQDLPYPGKLSLRSKIANVKAAAVNKEVQAITLRLLAEFRIAAAEYIYTR